MSDSFATPWTVAHQAPLSTGYPRQEYWNGLPLPSPGGLPDPGIKPESLAVSTLAGRFFTTVTPGKPVPYSKSKSLWTSIDISNPTPFFRLKGLWIWPQEANSNPFSLLYLTNTRLNCLHSSLYVAWLWTFQNHKSNSIIPALKTFQCQWNITQPFKKNAILPFAATRIDPETVMMSEASQTEKNKCHMIALTCRI